MDPFIPDPQYPNSTWYQSNPENILEYVKQLPVIEVRHHSMYDGEIRNRIVDKDYLSDEEIERRERASFQQREYLKRLSDLDREALKEKNRKAAKVYYYKHQAKILEQRKARYDGLRREGIRKASQPY